MKLLRLDLERFGHFGRGAANVPRLELPPGKLCLVHGDNEAGKTTVLEAIRWLLFGGTQANRFAIDVDPSALAVAASIELANGTALQIRRTRGRGAGLRGTTAAGDDVDEEWLLGRLHRPNRAVFENVFGFSIDALAQGAKALAHEELKSAIYGGGLGAAVHPDQILRDLRKQSEELFKEKGSTQKIQATNKRILALKTQVREGTTETAEWQRLNDELAAREADVVRAGEKRRSLRSTADQARARRDAFEHARVRAEALAQLATMQLPDALPPDAETTHARAVERRLQQEKAIRALRETVSSSTSLLDTLVVDEAILALEPEIEALVRGLERYEANLRDLPARRSELEDLTRRTRDGLAAVRPGWELDRLRAARLDVATRTELEAAIDEGETLEREGKRVATELAKLEEELVALDQQRLDLATAPLGDQRDVVALRAWSKEDSGDVARREQLKKVDAQCRTTERKHRDARLRLEPLLEDRDPTTLIVPRRETVAEHGRAVERLEAERSRLSAQRDERDAELRVESRELALVEALGHLPTESELAEVRAARDAIWSDVARALPVGHPDAPTLIVAFDGARTSADDAADRMRAGAKAVERRAAAEARRDALTAAIADLDTRVARATAALEAEHDRHRAAWARSGLVPLAPPAMLAWVDELQGFLALDAELAELIASREILRAEIDAHEARGRTLLAMEGSVGELRASALARVEAEDRRARDAESNEKLRVRETRKLAALREALRANDLARAAFAERFPELLERLGLERTLGRSAARAVVQGIAELRASFVDREELARDAIARTEVELASYEERACRAAGGPVADVALAVRALDRRRHEARAAHGERTATERARADAERRLAELEVEQASVNAEIAELHRTAGVADDLTFAHVAANRTLANQLQRDIEGAERSLARIFGAAPNSASLDELRARGLEALTEEVTAHEHTLEKLDEELGALERVVGDAHAKVAAIKGGSVASDALGELELARASLRADVDRWAVLTVAESILKGAIARFERDHQPELLARASSIFSSMTLGRYRGVRKAGEGLLCDRDDGRELAPESLSTGTREQLYLAVRLAYIDLYCKNAEPLPVVLDDVLVNFDEGRARATLEALSGFATTTQMLLFTCHRSTVRLVEESGIAASTLAIPASS